MKVQMEGVPPILGTEQGKKWVWGPGELAEDDTPTALPELWLQQPILRAGVLKFIPHSSGCQYQGIGGATSFRKLF